MAIVVDGGKLVEESDADMHAFFREGGRVHFVMMSFRAGVADCLQTLEHAHYKPGTSRNDLFILRYIKWHDLDWYILSIPRKERKFMRTAARANGLKVVDGIPTILTGGGAHRFPVRGENVFTLENVPGHPIYKRGRF